MPEDKLKKLHENLSKKVKDFTVDYNTFSSDMADEAKRKRLYDNLPKYFSGFNLDYNTFSSDLGFGEKKAQPDLTKVTPAPALNQPLNQQTQQQLPQNQVSSTDQLTSSLPLGSDGSTLQSMAIRPELQKKPDLTKPAFQSEIIGQSFKSLDAMMKDPMYGLKQHQREKISKSTDEYKARIQQREQSISDMIGADTVVPSGELQAQAMSKQAETITKSFSDVPVKKKKIEDATDFARRANALEAVSNSSGKTSSDYIDSQKKYMINDLLAKGGAYHEDEYYKNIGEEAKALISLNEAKKRGAIGEDLVRFEKEYQKAKDKRVASIDSEIEKVQQEIDDLSTGAAPSERNKLRKRIEYLNDLKSDVFVQDNPEKLADDTKGKISSQSLDLADMLPDSMSGKEKFDTWYFLLYRKQKELEKEIGYDKPGINTAGFRERLSWEPLDQFFGDGWVSLTEQEKEYWRNEKDLRALSSVFYINSQNPNLKRGFWDGFWTGMRQTSKPLIGGALNPSEEQRAGAIIETLKEIGIPDTSLNKDAVKSLSETAKPKGMFGEDFIIWNPMTWGDVNVSKMGETSGMLTDVMGTYLVGSAATKLGKTVLGAMAGAENAVKLKDAYTSALKSSPKIVRWMGKSLDEGTKFAVTGFVFPNQQDEFNFASGFLGNMAGRAISGGITKAVNSQMVNSMISSTQKVFGEKFGDAINVLTKAGAKSVERGSRGWGEVAEETTQELMQIWNETENMKEFWNEVHDRFGSMSKIQEFVVTTYAFGRVIGGTDAATEFKKNYEKLTDEEKAQIDPVLQEIEASKLEADNEVIREMQKDPAMKPILEEQFKPQENAKETRTEPETPGEKEAPGQESSRGLRLRNIAEDRVETQEVKPGEEVKPKKLFNEPNPETKEISTRYMESKGIKPSEINVVESLDQENSKRIADEFDKMKDDSANPEVQKAYEAMVNETADQAKSIADAGYTVEIYEGEGEPYANSEEMIKDIRDNKHIYVLSTEKEFGETTITYEMRAKNPLLRDSGIKDVNGKPLLNNDVFRYVHDFFGHSEKGNQFGPTGEENAWLIHSKMYSDEARKAMTTETRGQNSWVNFGKHMRGKEGQILKKGEEGYLTAKERPFAQQKMGFLPEDIIFPERKTEAEKPKAEARKPYELSPEEQEVETNLRSKLEDPEKYQQAKEEYIKKHGLVFDTDRAREFSEEYQQHPELLSGATQVPAREFVNKMYKEELEKAPPAGKENLVVFTSGGPGVGKSRAIEKMQYDQQLTVDTNLSNFERAKADIDEALAAGKVVNIAFTFRNPTEAFISKEGGVIERAKKEGRTVPFDVAVEINRKALKTIIELSEHYKNNDDVVFQYFSNEGKKGQPQLISLEDVKDINVDWEQSKKDIKNEVERAYKAGEFRGHKLANGQEISEEGLYAGFIGDTAALKRILGESRKVRPGVSEGTKGDGLKPSKAFKKAAELVRKAKIPKDLMDDLDKSAAANKIIIDVWNGATEAMANILEAGGKTSEVIEKAVAAAMNHLRESEWFKSLPEDVKKSTEEKLQPQFEKVADESIKAQEKSESEETAKAEEAKAKEGEEAVSPEEKVSEEPGEKERAFAKKVIASEEVGKEVKDFVKAESLVYEEIPNNITVEQANEIIKKLGPEAAMNEVLRFSNAIPDRVRVVIGIQLIKKFNDQGKKTENQSEKNANYDKAIDLADALSKWGTELGQTLQAFSLWDKMTVEGIIRSIKRDLDKQKKKVTEKNKRFISNVEKGWKKGTESAAKKAVKTSSDRAKTGAKMKKVTAFGLTKEEIAAKKKAALEKFKASLKGGKLTAGGLNPEAIEALFEYGKYVFAEKYRNAKEWIKKMKEETGVTDEDLLMSIWNSKEDENGNTLRDLAKVSSIEDVVSEHYVNDPEGDLANKLAETFGIDPDLASEIAASISKDFEAIVEQERQSEIKKRTGSVGKKKSAVIEDVSKEKSIKGDVVPNKVFESFGYKVDLPESFIDKINKLAEERDAAAEGSITRDEINIEILREAYKQAGVKKSDVLWSLWYANILSGYETQLLNVWSNAINILMEKNISVIEDVFRKGDVTAPFKIARNFKEMTSGIMEGIPTAIDVLKKGELAAKDFNTKLETKAVLDRVSFKGMKYPLNAWKYVGRFMSSVDSLAWYAARDMRLQELARQTAKEEGLSGQALINRVSELLGSSKEEYKAAEQEAKQALDIFLERTGRKMTVKEYERRVRREAYRIMEKNVPSDLIEEANKFGDFATYNYAPKGTLGIFAQLLSTATQKVPPFRFIVPFTRVVANVLNQQIDYTPWGYVRAWRGGITGQMKPETQSEFFRETTKATIGTMLMVGLMIMASSSGDDDEDREFDITGKGPSDYNKKYQLMQTGWKPYSVKVNGTYVSYQYTPLGIGLSWVGNWLDNEKYQELGKKDAMSKVAYGVKSSASGIMDMSFLTGLSGLMEALSSEKDPAKDAESFMKSLAKTTAGSVIPNLVKQIDKNFVDQTIYEGKTFSTLLMKDIPVARTYLKPQINILGEETTRQREGYEIITGRLVSGEKEHPVFSFLVKRNVFIPGAKPSTKLENGTLMNDDQFYDYIKLSGEIIKKTILDNKEELEAIADTDKLQKEISSITRAARQAAKSILTAKAEGEDPEEWLNDIDYDVNAAEINTEDIDLE